MISFSIFLACVAYYGTNAASVKQYEFRTYVGLDEYACHCNCDSTSFAFNYEWECDGRNIINSTNNDALTSFCECLKDTCKCSKLVVQSLHKRAPGDCFAKGSMRDRQPVVIDPVTDSLIMSKFVDSVGKSSIYDTYSMKMADNPILKDPTTAQATLSEQLTKLADPTIIDDTIYRSRPKDYVRRFWTGLVQMHDYLKSGGKITVKQLIDAGGEWRQMIAYEKYKKKNYVLPADRNFVSDWRAFGLKRTDVGRGDTASTPLGGNYVKQSLDGKITVQDLANAWKNGGPFDKLIEVLNRGPAEPLSEVQKDPDFQFPTTVTAKDDVRVNGGGVEMFYYGIESNSPLPQWNVLNTYANKVIIDKMEVMHTRIIEAAKDVKVTNDEYLKMVSSIHWFISNTSPFHRGSAAVAEFTTSTYFAERGLIFPGWKQGMSGDVTALCTANLATYQQIFVTNLAKWPADKWPQ